MDVTPEMDSWIKQMHGQMADPPAPPARLAGRAFVTMTSQRYFAGTYVLAKMLYHVGVADPLYVYYRPHDPPPARLGELPNVRLFDVSAIVPEQERWELQAVRTALFMRCGLARIFWLGSDCYPVTDPSYVFEDAANHWAVFWEDQPEGDRFEPAMYGLPEWARNATYQVQGDTVALDVAKAWKALALTHWFNVNGHHFYQHAWGDQTQLRAAWHLTGACRMKYAEGAVDWESFPGIFLHQGTDGATPLIVHRVASKWHAGGSFSMPLTRDNRLPMESVAWGYYEDWLRGKG